MSIKVIIAFLAGCCGPYHPEADEPIIPIITFGIAVENVGYFGLEISRNVGAIFTLGPLGLWGIVIISLCLSVVSICLSIHPSTCLVNT